VKLAGAGGEEDGVLVHAPITAYADHSLVLFSIFCCNPPPSSNAAEYFVLRASGLPADFWSEKHYKLIFASLILCVPTSHLGQVVMSAAVASLHNTSKKRPAESIFSQFRKKSSLLSNSKTDGAARDILHYIVRLDFPDSNAASASTTSTAATSSASAAISAVASAGATSLPSPHDRTDIKGDAPIIIKFLKPVVTIVPFRKKSDLLKKLERFCAHHKIGIIDVGISDVDQRIADVIGSIGLSPDLQFSGATRKTVILAQLDQTIRPTAALRKEKEYFVNFSVTLEEPLAHELDRVVDAKTDFVDGIRMRVFEGRETAEREACYFMCDKLNEANFSKDSLGADLLYFQDSNPSDIDVEESENDESDRENRFEVHPNFQKDFEILRGLCERLLYCEYSDVLPCTLTRSSKESLGSASSKITSGSTAAASASAAAASVVPSSSVDDEEATDRLLMARKHARKPFVFASQRPMKDEKDDPCKQAYQPVLYSNSGELQKIGPVYSSYALAKEYAKASANTTDDGWNVIRLDIDPSLVSVKSR
jgi:hypothetical protein